MAVKTNEITHRASRELGPSVRHVDGKMKLVWASASLITQADHNSEGGCLRRLWFEKVLGRERPTTEQQKAGTEMHSRIEHYQRTGEMVLRNIELAGKHFIQGPGEGLLIEQPMVDHKDQVITLAPLVANGRTPIAGHQDNINLRGVYIDSEGELRQELPNTVESKDWKSTSSLAYAKTGPQVADLIQMTTYAQWILTVMPWLENVRSTHVYFQRTKPKAQLSTAVRTREQISTRWKYAEGIVRTIEQAIEETDANKVTPNTRSCYSYNKQCEHMSLCTAGSHNSLDNVLSKFDKIAQDAKQEIQMGILDSIPQFNPGTVAAPQPTPFVQPQALVPPQPDLREQLAREEAELRAKQAAVQAQGQPQQVVMDLKAVWARIQAYGRGAPALAAEAAQALAQAHGQTMGTQAGIAGTGELGRLMLKSTQDFYIIASELEAEHQKGNGSVAAAPSASEPVQFAPPPVVQAPPVQAQVNTALLPPNAGQNQIPAPKPEAAPAEAPKRRGRPPGPKPEGYRDTIPAPSVEGGAAESASAQAASPFIPVSTNALEVYINCLPAKPTKSLAGYVDFINETLSKRYCVDAQGQPTVQDVRCAPKDSPLGFGGWKGAVARTVADSPPPDDAYHLDTRGNELAEMVADGLRIACSKKNALYVKGY